MQAMLVMIPRVNRKDMAYLVRFAIFSVDTAQAASSKRHMSIPTTNVLPIIGHHFSFKHFDDARDNFKFHEAAIGVHGKMFITVPMSVQIVRKARVP
jgi:hypothetical protein